MSSSRIHERLARLTCHQHGVVTTRQLVECGLDRPRITRWTVDGRLFRVHRSVYAVVGPQALSREGRFMAAVLAVGHDAALARLTAAVHLGIWKRGWSGIDVVSPRPFRGRLERVRVHQTRSLRPRDVYRHRGIRTTGTTRTLLDLGHDLTMWQLCHAMHEAAFRQRLDERALGRRIQETTGMRAVTVARAALAMHRSGSAGTKSELEDDFVALLLRNGLDVPLVNVRVATPIGALEPDFRWPAERVVVETDGGGHARRYNRRSDADFDRQFQALGYTVIRASTDDVRLDAELLVARLRATLAAAG